LVYSLILEDKKDKALQVLDKAMEVIPAENVSLDYSTLSFGEYYYELDKPEKAEAILTAIIEDSFQNLNWYYRLRPGQMVTVVAEIEHNLAVIQEIMRISKNHNGPYEEKYKEEFDNYRMVYTSAFRNN
jgi:tetratricopeptide (TPR) repeat protein